MYTIENLFYRDRTPFLADLFSYTCELIPLFPEHCVAAETPFMVYRSGRLCPDRVEGVMLIPRHTRFESILLMDELLVIANEIKHERYSAYQISQLDTWSALIYAEVYEIIMRSDLCVSAAKQLRHRLH